MLSTYFYEKQLYFFKKTEKSGIVLHFCKQICKNLQPSFISAFVGDSWVLGSAVAFNLC